MHELTTPRGRPAVIVTRDQTSDLAVAGSVFAGVAGAPLVDEYRLRDLHIRGTFVDVGAHIGSVTVAVLLDNPDCRAICVEPIPENIDVLTANLAENGLAHRAVVIVGAVGTNAVSYGFEGSEVAATNRYIGNLHIDAPGKRIRTRRVTLADLLPAEAMKLDCEGGEWAIFAEPEITSVRVVFGEYHGRPGSYGVLERFAKTHAVTFANQDEGTGNFWAVAR
jgi:FkbM family methyltransferase